MAAIRTPGSRERSHYGLSFTEGGLNVSFWTEALGAQVRYYDAGPWRTRAIEAGAGEAVIMMHGVSGHAETFVRNVVPIANAGFHVYAIDAIGHGFSAKPLDVFYDSATFRRHVIAFMDALGIRKAHLVGQSLGGWTAFDIARHHPDRVASLVSLTGAGILLDTEADRKKSEEVHAAVRSVTLNALDEPTRETIRKRLEWLMADPSRVSDELVETRYQIVMLPDSREALPKMVVDQTGPENRSQMFREADLRALVHPTLIVWTDQNPTTPQSVGRDAAQLMPNARFELIEDAGHWPQYEQFARVNELVVQFLSNR
jgi:pimeloyl-ACP methyl ester carboxylesterase